MLQEAESKPDIKVVVRELEMLTDEMERVGKRVRSLQKRKSELKGIVEEFMNTKGYESIQTKDQRLTITMKTKKCCLRPGKRETIRCITEELDDQPELANEIIRKLFEIEGRMKTETYLERHTG